MSRIAVIGAGSIGSYFGGRAAIAGADVTLCLRRPRPDLVIRTGEDELRPPVRAVTDPADVGPVDWVLLSTKAHQTPGAANWLRALDGPPLVILQNGVRLPARVEGLWGGPVVPAVPYCAVEMVSPGIIEHHSYGSMIVARNPTGQALANEFGADQREVRQVDDLDLTAWEKLVLNVGGNSLTALTGRRLEVLHEPAVGELARTVMTECAAVARAEGVPVADDIADRLFDSMLRMPTTQGTSMLYDRLAGAELEHDALIGAVVAIGSEHGVPTPASTALLALLRAVSRRPVPSDRPTGQPADRCPRTGPDPDTTTPDRRIPS